MTRFTVSIYVSAEADKQDDVNALAEELTEMIQRHESKYGADILEHAVSWEVEEEYGSI